MDNLSSWEAEWPNKHTVFKMEADNWVEIIISCHIIVTIISLLVVRKFGTGCSRCQVCQLSLRKKETLQVTKDKNASVALNWKTGLTRHH